MSNELIAMVFMACFQFILVVIMGLVSFAFKTSITNVQNSIDSVKVDLNKSIDEIKEGRKEDRRDRQHLDDKIFQNLRDIEEKKADKTELNRLEKKIEQVKGSV